MRWNLIAAVLIGAARVACSSGRVSEAASKANPSPALSTPQYDKGIVVGHTYKNNSVGLEFTLPLNFQFRSPEVKGTPSKPSSFVSVTAWGIRQVSFFRSFRSNIAFISEALSDYPAGYRSTEDHLERVIKSERRTGFNPVGTEVRAQWGGAYFSRVDFWRPPAYEAVFVKACRNQVLTFVFASLDLKSVNRLFAESKLDLNMAASHCVPNEERKFIPFDFGPGRVPTFSGRIMSRSLAGTSLTVMFQLTNTTIGTVQYVYIDRIRFKTLAGTGAVTYLGRLPISAGDFGIGASRTLTLTMNVPSTVRKFSIRESGTVQDVISGNTWNFSLVQVVNP